MRRGAGLCGFGFVVVVLYSTAPTSSGLGLQADGMLDAGSVGPEKTNRSYVQDLKDLLKWGRTSGVSTSSSWVLRKTNYGGFGIFLKRDVKKGERIIELPRRLAFGPYFWSSVAPVARRLKDLFVTLTRNKFHLSSGILVDLDLAQVSMLCFTLLLEKHHPSGSFWGPYFKTLPERMTSSLTFPDQERGLIEQFSVSVLKEVNRLENRVLSVWKTIHEILLSSEFGKGFLSQFDGNRFPWSMENVKWAFIIVTTRAFYLASAPNNPAQLVGLCLIPFLEMPNHEDKSLTGVDFGTLLTRPCTIDSSQESCDSIGPVLVAGRDYRAGEELKLTYGRMGNNRLLCQYGFVLENNSIGIISYRVSLSEVLYREVKPLPNGVVESLDRHGINAEAWYPITNENPAPRELYLALRVAHLIPEEEPLASRAVVHSSPVSLRNEKAVITSLTNYFEEQLGKMIPRDTEVLLMGQVKSKGRSGNALRAILLALVEERDAFTELVYKIHAYGRNESSLQSQIDVMEQREARATQGRRRTQSS